MEKTAKNVFNEVLEYSEKSSSLKVSFFLSSDILFPANTTDILKLFKHMNTEV